MNSFDHQQNSDLQLAETVLKVLKNYAESDFQLLEKSIADNDSAQIPPSALLDYDLDKSPCISLPGVLEHVTAKVLAHLESTADNDPWGLIENDVVVLKLNDRSGSRRGRLLLFTSKYISGVLENLFPQERITLAEQRTLLQSLSGLSLKEAAQIDTVSYETKKSQLRSVFQKTQIKKQQVLSVFLITHLTLELAATKSRQTTNPETDELFFHYVDNYMGEYVRASVVQESADKRFRMIELGDPSGTPVVCIHHLGLINFSQDEIAEIHRQGIRLICPLRHGALGPVDDKISSSEHLEHAMAGINLAVSLAGSVAVSMADTMAGNGRVPIIALLSGSLYALNYFQQHPDKVKQIILLGASYKQPKKIVSSSDFKSSLHQLASNHKETFERTVSSLIDNVEDTESLQAVMKESHNNSAADFETIDELFSDKVQVTAMQTRLKNSALSITEDLITQSKADWSGLLNNNPDSGGETPVHFLHGDQDTLIPYRDIKRLVDSQLRFRLHTVKGAGNWIFGKYTRETMTIVRNILTDTPDPAAH